MFGSSGFKVWALGFRYLGLGLGVYGPGFGLWILSFLDFRSWSLEFRVQVT